MVAAVAVVAAVAAVVPGLGVVVDAVDLPQQQRAERGNFGLDLSLRVSAMIMLISSLVRGREITTSLSLWRLITTTRD